MSRTTDNTKKREDLARRMAKKLGYRLQKSRAQWPGDYLYCVIDDSINAVRFHSGHIDYVIAFLS